MANESENWVEMWDVAIYVHYGTTAWSQVIHPSLSCFFSWSFGGQYIYTTLCNSTIPFSSLWSTVAAATDCTELQVQKHVSSREDALRPFLPVTAKHWFFFFLKVGNIYSIALGLTLLVRMGDYGMMWLMERFFSSNNSFCNSCRYAIWLPLQTSPRALGMLPEGKKFHNQFSHSFSHYYIFFKGKVVLQIVFRLMTERVRIGKIAQAPARNMVHAGSTLIAIGWEREFR